MSGIHQFFWVSSGEDLTVTSVPYPIESEEVMTTSLSIIAMRIYVGNYIDSLTTSLSIQSASVTSTLKSYTQPPEDVIATSLSIQSVSVISTLQSYVHPPEDVIATSLSIQSAYVERQLISYDSGSEAIATDLSIISVSKT